METHTENRLVDTGGESGMNGESSMLSHFSRVQLCATP